MEVFSTAAKFSCLILIFYCFYPDIGMVYYFFQAAHNSEESSALALNAEDKTRF
jgi:hypothetical protein